MKEEIKINNSDWEELSEVKEEDAKYPVWLKLENGNIVLSMWGDNGGGCIGWWAVQFSEEGKFFRRGNMAYIAKNALWQPCSFFN